MDQRKMIDVPVGTPVRSSVRAPIDGQYEFAEHLAQTDCKPGGADATIYRGRGELLPACRVCGKRGVWKLAEAKYEVVKDNTPFVVKEVRGDRPDLAYPSGSKR
jgi:hypothetical protein